MQLVRQQRRSLRPSAGPPFGSTPYPLDAPRVWIVSRWNDGDDRDRLRKLRAIVTTSARDPRIATLTVGILRHASVQPRDYRGQAAALLSWVQHRIYYVNEPDERLQDPIYTLSVGFGDCDDLALLLAALLWSIRLPYRFVIAGHRKIDHAPVRYVEGEGSFPSAAWAHIYLAIGPRPFATKYEPDGWAFAEPTLKGAPLGWDVFAEKQGVEGAGFAGTTGTSVASTGSGLASALTLGGELSLTKVLAAIVVGTLTMLSGSIVMDWYHERKR